jgi:hypothetical protein
VILPRHRALVAIRDARVSPELVAEWRAAAEIANDNVMIAGATRVRLPRKAYGTRKGRRKP